MRNRYKSDVNRLIEFPRRRSVPRRLLSPGAIMPAYSSVLFSRQDLPPEFEAGFYFLPVLMSSNLGVTTYGEPLNVNEPLGTSGGSNPAWALQLTGPTSQDLDRAKGGEKAGMRNWTDGPEGDLAISWDGPPSRYSYVDDEWVAFSRQAHDYWFMGWQVYHRLEVMLNLFQQPEVGSYDVIFGAAIRRDGPDLRLMVIVSNSEQGTGGFRAYEFSLDESRSVVGSGTLLHTSSFTSGLRPSSGWYFNPTGTKAVCTLRTSNGNNVHRAEWDVSAGFDLTQIYNRSDYNTTRSRLTQAFRTISRVDNGDGTCGAWSLGESDVGNWVDDDEYSQPEILIPMYVDYVGDELVTVYYQQPEMEFHSYGRRKMTHKYNEYPHPCAGEHDPGGGVYPETYRPGVPSETVHEIEFGLQSGEVDPARIVTSKGQTLLVFPDTNRVDELRSLNYNDELVSLNLPCGSINIEDRQYAAVSNYSEIECSLSSLVVDARHQFCAAVWQRGGDVRESLRSESRDYEDDIRFSSTTRFLDLPGGTRDVFQRREVAVWLDGSQVYHQVLHEENSSPAYDGVLSGDAVTIPSYPFINECSYSISTTLNDTTSTIFGPSVPFIVGREDFGDGQCVALRGRKAISVTCRNASGALASYQWVEGLGNPVVELMERPADTAHTMHRLTIY